MPINRTVGVYATHYRDPYWHEVKHHKFSDAIALSGR